MITIQFYHLLTTPLERALPKLLEKAYAGKFRTLLVAESEAQLEQLNQLLWTYDPNAFLPHGSVKDGSSDQQPILLATTMARANDANLLVVTDGRTPEQPEQFERIIDIFNGNDDHAVSHARTRWTQYKQAGHALTYLQQTAQGGWEQKATT